MARRKDSGNPVLAVIALALAAVAVMGPFLISGWVIFSEVRAWRYRHASRPSHLVTPAERAELEACEAHLAHLRAQMSDLVSLGRDQGFAHRDSDGLFDARNPAARDLNHRIEDLAYQCEDARNRLAAVRAPLEARMEGWTHARSSLIGARSALVAFVAVFVAILVADVQATGAALTASTLMFGAGADGGERLMASGVATLAAGLAAWIGGSVTRGSIAA